jgi:hypothetical protein
MDSIIVGTTLACSFGAAFAMQRMALSLLLRAMHKSKVPPADAKNSRRSRACPAFSMSLAGHRARNPWLFRLE